jgi:hypothetical protein
MGLVWMTVCLTALAGCFGGRAAAQPKPSLTETPSSPINIAGPQGGPFSPPSIQYHLSTSTGTIRFVIAVPFWLSADPRTGTVGTDGATVTLSPSPHALKLGPRVYEAPVTFTNVSNGQGTTRTSAKLTVQRSTTPSPSRLLDDGKSPTGLSSERLFSVCPRELEKTIRLLGWWRRRPRLPDEANTPAEREQWRTTPRAVAPCSPNSG